VAVRYSTDPTGTGCKNVLGSRAMKVGRECDVAEAQVNANSNVDFSKKPPKIMKLCLFLYCGCMICTEWMVVDDMYTADEGFLAGVAGSW